PRKRPRPSGAPVRPPASTQTQPICRQTHPTPAPIVTQALATLSPHLATPPNTSQGYVRCPYPSVPCFAPRCWLPRTVSRHQKLMLLPTRYLARSCMSASTSV